MTAPEKFTVRLNEPAVTGDATSGQQSEQLPTYNAYSIDGDVTAPLVYVNYGVPADYEELENRGIDVKGQDRHRAIRRILARHQAESRGRTRSRRLHHLFRSANDGFYQGDVYPKGAWRSENGVQRGSVMDMPLYPGDPLTTGIGAIRRCKTPRQQGRRDAHEDPCAADLLWRRSAVLRNLDGAGRAGDWRGALPITYHFGGGAADRSS